MDNQTCQEPEKNENAEKDLERLAYEDAVRDIWMDALQPRSKTKTGR